jgi:hypothetical protein
MSIFPQNRQQLILQKLSLHSQRLTDAFVTVFCTELDCHTTGVANPLVLEMARLL